MTFDASDGGAIVGYAGLGRTLSGIEPSKWMAAVLRGRKNISVEQSLGILANAMLDQLPKHLKSFSNPDIRSHATLAVAIVGGEPRLFTIGVGDAGVKGYGMSFERRIAGHGFPPRFAVTGSGSAFLPAKKVWTRDLLRILSAHDRGMVGPIAVEKVLAKINLQVSRADKFKSVGPSCVVAGKFIAGGGHSDWIGHSVACGQRWIPTIVNGIDLTAIAEILAPTLLKNAQAMFRGDDPPGIDEQAFNCRIAKLPEFPDEDLK